LEKIDVVFCSLMCVYVVGRWGTKSGGECVVSRLELYRTNVLLHSTYVLLARLTKVRCYTCDMVKIPRSTIRSGRFTDPTTRK
jgi:hypothetical protein